jgi:DNA-binding NarL/FixJ family response regulator
MGNPIRIILADDHALVVEGLRGLLEQVPDFQVVATALNGDELLQLLAEHPADVLVLDLQMPFHGLKALAQIREQGIPVRVLVLTAFSDGESIQAALELAADGFALKTESPMQTIEAIRQVAQGRLLFPRSAQRWLAGHREETTTESDKLSSRESETLSYIAKGYTNPEIAAALSISENTVRFHLKNIYEKLGVANRTEAAAWYFKHSRGSNFE